MLNTCSIGCAIWTATGVVTGAYLGREYAWPMIHPYLEGWRLPMSVSAWGEARVKYTNYDQFWYTYDGEAVGDYSLYGWGHIGHARADTRFDQKKRTVITQLILLDAARRIREERPDVKEMSEGDACFPKAWRAIGGDVKYYGPYKPYSADCTYKL